MLSWFRRAPLLETYDLSASREALIQSGRLLFVDDEQVPLIEQLKHAGFAVDHDRTGSEFEQQIDNQTYDVAILDYSGVGEHFGDGQGLDLLRHVRRVSPRTRIIAYTSKALKSDKSDFYRLADTVLAKDSGKRESLEVVEDQLRKAFGKQHLFDALIGKIAVTSPQKRQEIKEVLEKSLKSGDQSQIRKFLKKTAGAAAERGIDIVLSRLFFE